MIVRNILFCPRSSVDRARLRSVSHSSIPVAVPVDVKMRNRTLLSAIDYIALINYYCSHE